MSEGNRRGRRSWVAMFLLAGLAGSLIVGGASLATTSGKSTDVAHLRSHDYTQRVFNSAGPLHHIYLDGNLSCQVEHLDDDDPDFYGGTDPGACGTFLATDGSVFGPNVPAGNSRIPYEPVSMTPITGTGSSGDPFSVTTVVDVPEKNLQISQTDTYVIGADNYKSQITVQNNSASPKSATLYHAGDCYLNNDDSSYGYRDTAEGSIFCSTIANSRSHRILGFIPQSAGSHYYQDNYSDVWDAIDGTDFPDTCDCATDQDTGAGLSWSLSVAGNGSETRTLLTKVGGNEPPPAGTISASNATISVPNTPSGQPLSINVQTDSLGRRFYSIPRSQAGQFPGGCVPLTLTVPINPGSSTLSNPELVLNTGRYPMTNAGGNNWTATIPCVESGRLFVEFDLTENGTTQHYAYQLGGLALIDPQGVVYDKVTFVLARVSGKTPAQARTQAAIAGAVVTLQRHNGGGFATVLSGDPGISPNVNPETTAADGRYQWDVSAGQYRVVVTKSGYKPVTSRVVNIPPPVLDLHIAMDPCSTKKGKAKKQCLKRTALLSACIGKKGRQRRICIKRANAQAKCELKTGKAKRRCIKAAKAIGKRR